MAFVVLLQQVCRQSKSTLSINAQFQRHWDSVYLPSGCYADCHYFCIASRLLRQVISSFQGAVLRGAFISLCFIIGYAVQHHSSSTSLAFPYACLVHLV